MLAVLRKPLSTTDTGTSSLLWTSQAGKVTAGRKAAGGGGWERRSNPTLSARTAIQPRYSAAL